MKPHLARTVIERANNRCEYCRLEQQFVEIRFEFDHIIARQHGGPTESDNLALICQACNKNKGPNLAGYDFARRRVVRLFHPREDVWEEHFAWRDAFLVGVTDIGEATIQVLKINWPNRVNKRRHLIAEGVFPPP